MLGGEAHDEDVYRHEDAPPAYAPARRDHEAQRGVEEAGVVGRVQGEELLVMQARLELEPAEAEVADPAALEDPAAFEDPAAWVAIAREH